MNPPDATFPQTTILVVEDEPAMRTLLTKLLSRQGFNVLAAGDVSGAQSLLHGADLLLIDINLGRDDGMDFVEQLRERGCDKPAFMMSGLVSDEKNARAKELTRHNIIPKPFTSSELLGSIRCVLDGPATH